MHPTRAEQVERGLRALSDMEVHVRADTPPHPQYRQDLLAALRLGFDVISDLKALVAGYEAIVSDDDQARAAALAVQHPSTEPWVR